MDGHQAEVALLEREAARQRRELSRADSSLAAATAGLGPLQGEHVALQSSVTSELKVGSS